LTILALCSYSNTMARQLYVKLQIIFNDIREIAVSPIYRTMCEMRIVVKDVALVPISHYQAIVGAEEVSKTILDIARSSMSLLHEKISI
jgi:hypothetical protein